MVKHIKSEIDANIYYENFRRLIILIPAVITFLVAMVLLMDLRKPVYKPMLIIHLVSIGLYTLFFVVAILIRPKNLGSLKLIHKIIFLTVMYSFFILTIHTTLLLQQISNSIAAYIICVFGVSAFFVLPIGVRISALVLSGAIVITALFFVQDDILYRIPSQLQIGMLTLLTFLFSSYLFKMFSQKIIQQQKLDDHEKALSIQNTTLKRLLNENDHLMNVLIHDIRGPIAQVHMALELMNDHSEENEEIQKLKNVGLHGTNICFNIIQDLTLLKQIANNDLQLMMNTVDLANSTKIAINEFKHEMEKKGISIELTLDEDSSVVSNQEALSIIFRNLISNAVKFSQNGSVIRIRIEKKDEAVLWVIKDEGPGFTRDDKEKLFVPFQTLSAKPTGGETSTGLGLSIIKMLTDRLSVSLRLDSDSTNTGSLFTLIFPQ